MNINTIEKNTDGKEMLHSLKPLTRSDNLSQDNEDNIISEFLLLQCNNNDNNICFDEECLTKLLKLLMSVTTFSERLALMQNPDDLCARYNHMFRVLPKHSNIDEKNKKITVFEQRYTT